HRENSAKRGICASTKYLRCSTSSKYSRVPTALGECRMLQGLAFQKLRTASIGTSANGRSASMVCCRPVPQLLEHIAGAGPCGRTAAVRHVFDSWSAGQLGREDSPEVDNQHRPPIRAEVARRQLFEFGIRRGDQDYVGVAETITGRVHDQRAPP